MKRKLVFTFGLTGVLALIMGFGIDLPSTKVSAAEQTVVASKQTEITTVITKEEQNKVENMSVKEGLVPQENRTGFLFIKEK